MAAFIRISLGYFGRCRCCSQNRQSSQRLSRQRPDRSSLSSSGDQNTHWRISTAATSRLSQSGESSGCFSSMVIGTKEEPNIVGGCHLDRKIDALIRHTGLRIEAIDAGTKIVRSYVRHHTVEPIRFQNSSHRFMECSISLDGQISTRSFLLPLCQCGNLYGTTMWFAWIAAIGENAATPHQ